MTKHIVCIALEVDSKYSARAVMKEIQHGVQCFDSELFDTLAGVYVARTPVQTFTVWTSAKADGCDTYEELIAYEESTGYGYSSQVTTDDIEAIVDCVNNELDGELLYHLESA